MPTDLRARDALFEDILRGSAIGLPARKVRFGLVLRHSDYDSLDVTFWRGLFRL
jgi:hypothetical protein